MRITAYLSYRRIRRYSVGRLKRLEACDFSHVRFTKAKQCLIALLSGVLLVLLCICTTLYNETLRCCFAIGEKNIKKLMINGELVIEWIKEKSIKDVVVENICYD